MHRKRLSLTVVSLLLAVVLRAQYDSTTFNAGTLKLSRQFTQNITIKSEDLERFPFTSLEEAINVYFNGAYTNAQDVVYVVDGNTGVDVNAYNIHDIESISLLQDARAITAGTHRAQQLVLVRTRTGMTRSAGITAAASTYITRRRDQNNSNLYHQLYASGRFYRKNMEMGASLSYLHEAYPTEATDKTIHNDPQYLNRFTANAWLAATLGRSILSVRLNAAPDKSGSGQYYAPSTGVTSNEREHTKNLQLYPTATLSTRINDHFYNQIDAGYNRRTIRSFGDQLLSYDTSYFYKSIAYSRNRYDEIFLREEVGANVSANRWRFSPALNIYGQQIKSSANAQSSSISNTGAGSWSISENQVKEKGIVFTPLINITHDQNFNFQGGAQYSTSKRFKTQVDNRLHPFAALSLDIARTINRHAPLSLMLNGSYAETKSDLIDFYQPAMYVFQFTNGVIERALISPAYTPLYRIHRATSAGVSVGLLDNRIKFFFTREQKDYYINSYISTNPATGYNYVIADGKVKLRSQRFGIQYQTTKEKQVRYTAIVGACHMQPSIAFSNPNIYISPLISQSFSPHEGWSGGLNQQLSYKKFSAGTSMLYYFNEHTWEAGNQPGSQPTFQKFNSFVLQHIYAGYEFNRFELYLSGRNLLRKGESSAVNSDVAYYGAGIKTKL
jgi:hypothetical protein